MSSFDCREMRLSQADDGDLSAFVEARASRIHPSPYVDLLNWWPNGFSSFNLMEKFKLGALPPDTSPIPDTAGNFCM